MEELTAMALRAEEELILPHHRRAFLEQVQGAQGERALVVHYRELEIEFDEPELFEFAERLIAQDRFVAGSAASWGAGYTWPQVRELLETLLARGVLRHASACTGSTDLRSAVLPSPLPAASTTSPRSWSECEQLSAELLGQAVELAHLELLVPLHRIAHPALDREGRQVGEANVFPPQLRLDVDTEWRRCQYPGSRYQDEFPLNASALRSMQKWWRPVLTLMARARAHYVQRYPHAATSFSLLDVHNFSCVLMGWPAYAMLRARQPVRSGELHPALSSLARLADGARMTANELLTVDALDTRVTGRELHDSAERTNLFLSTYGVCAGPRKAIETFLSQLTEGGGLSEPLDSELEALCGELEGVLDWSLHALRSYALSSFAWASASESYERLHAALADLPPTAFKARITADWQLMAPALGNGSLRQQHADLYDGMWRYCARGLAAESSNSLQALEAEPVPAELQKYVHAALPAHLAEIVLDQLRAEQPLTAAAETCQMKVNACLGRAPARSPLRAEVLFLGHRLRHPAARLPYVMDALRDELGLRIRVTSNAYAPDAT